MVIFKITSINRLRLKNGAIKTLIPGEATGARVVFTC